MPCTWLKITSQYDLSDYAVEIRLDQLGVLGSVSDDGSDIYFLDENNQPLYCAVWLIRKDKNYGSVFVKLSLKSGFRRICICYGERNRYQEYNNPDAITEPGSIALRTWDRLGEVRVDKILVRHAVDPEPTVEVEKPVPRSKPQILPPAVSTTALIGIKKATQHLY